MIGRPREFWRYGLTPDRVYYFRKAFGLSQKKFAAILGVSNQTIVNWESGYNAPDKRCANRLNVLINTNASPEITRDVLNRALEIAEEEFGVIRRI